MSKNKNRSKTSGRKGRGRRQKGQKPLSETRRAGLVMPVPRIRKYVRDGRYAPRISRSAPCLVFVSMYISWCSQY